MCYVLLQCDDDVLEAFVLREFSIMPAICLILQETEPHAPLSLHITFTETSVQGTYDDADSQGGSPRPKRRRLFKGTVQSPSNSDPAAFQEMLAPFKSDAVDCLLPESDEQENSISIPSIWYKDESQSSLADNVEPMAESWMITCIEDNGNNSCVSQMETTALVTETPELWTPSGQPCEDPAVLQGPATPFSSRPSTPGKTILQLTGTTFSYPPLLCCCLRFCRLIC
jgi:hypothetical protein